MARLKWIWNLTLRPKKKKQNVLQKYVLIKQLNMLSLGSSEWTIHACAYCTVCQYSFGAGQFIWEVFGGGGNFSVFFCNGLLVAVQLIVCKDMSQL